MRIGHIGSVHRYPVKSMAGESLDQSEVGANGLIGDRTFALRDDDAGELRSARKWPRLLQCSARYREQPSREKVPAVEIGLPDGSQISSDDEAASRRLSSFLGVNATLCPLRPASDKQHYRRASSAAVFGGVLARSNFLKKAVAGFARLGVGVDMREEFGREPGEPLPDLSVFPAEVFSYVSPPGTYFDAFPIHLLTSASLAEMRRLHPAGDWDVRRFRPNFVIETALTGLVEAAWAGRTVRIGEVELECVVPTVRCNVVMQSHSGLRKDPLILRTIVREAKQDLGIYARVRRQGRVATGDVVELV